MLKYLNFVSINLIQIVNVTIKSVAVNGVTISYGSSMSLVDEPRKMESFMVPLINVSKEHYLS